MSEREWKTIQIAPVTTELYVRAWSKFTPYGQPVDIEGFPSRPVVAVLLQVDGDASRVVLATVDVHGNVAAVEPGVSRHRFVGVHSAGHTLKSDNDPLGESFQEWKNKA